MTRTRNRAAPTFGAALGGVLCCAAQQCAAFGGPGLLDDCTSFTTCTPALATLATTAVRDVVIHQTAGYVMPSGLVAGETTHTDSMIVRSTAQATATRSDAAGGDFYLSANARAQTDFGTTRAQASSDRAVGGTHHQGAESAEINLFASGQGWSSWRDVWSFSANGHFNAHVAIDGTTSLAGPRSFPAGYVYGLNPFNFAEWSYDLKVWDTTHLTSGSPTLVATAFAEMQDEERPSFALMLALDFDFVSSASYVVTVEMKTLGANGWGVNLFNTARLQDVGLSNGAQLIALSGHDYVSAVPEPAPGVFMLAGLAGLAWRARRRWARATPRLAAGAALAAAAQQCAAFGGVGYIDECATFTTCTAALASHAQWQVRYFVTSITPGYVMPFGLVAGDKAYDGDETVVSTALAAVSRLPQTPPPGYTDGFFLSASARAQTDFGVHRVRADSDRGLLGNDYQGQENARINIWPYAAASSATRDVWTFNANGHFSASVAIDGTTALNGVPQMSPSFQNGPLLHSGGWSFNLKVWDVSNLSFDVEGTLVPTLVGEAALSRGGAPFGSFDDTLAVDFDFVAGVSYVVTTELSATSDKGERIDAFNTARLHDVVLSGGAQMSALSGHDYLAPVPEPGRAALWLVGLALVAGAARRRRHLTAALSLCAAAPGALAFGDVGMLPSCPTFTTCSAAVGSSVFWQVSENLTNIGAGFVVPPHLTPGLKLYNGADSSTTTAVLSVGNGFPIPGAAGEFHRGVGGRAQSDFAVNRVETSMNRSVAGTLTRGSGSANLSLRTFVEATSAWRDVWAFSGSGQFTALVAVNGGSGLGPIGSFDPSFDFNPLGTYADWFFDLRVWDVTNLSVSDDFELGGPTLVARANVTGSDEPRSSFASITALSFSFAAGVSYVVTAEIRATSYDGREIDLFHTARLQDVVLGNGAQMSTLSGHDFLAPVPEPQTAALFAAGAVALLLGCRRRA